MQLKIAEEIKWLSVLMIENEAIFLNNINAVRFK